MFIKCQVIVGLRSEYQWPRSHVSPPKIMIWNTINENVETEKWTNKLKSDPIVTF